MATPESDWNAGPPIAREGLVVSSVIVVLGVVAVTLSLGRPSDHWSVLKLLGVFGGGFAWLATLFWHDFTIPNPRARQSTGLAPTPFVLTGRPSRAWRGLSLGLRVSAVWPFLLALRAHSLGAPRNTVLIGQEFGLTVALVMHLVSASVLAVCNVWLAGAMSMRMAPPPGARWWVALAATAALPIAIPWPTEVARRVITGVGVDWVLLAYAVFAFGPLCVFGLLAVLHRHELADIEELLAEHAPSDDGSA